MNKDSLNAKKQLYENLKKVLDEVVLNLSSTNFNDGLMDAKRALSSYFYVNDEDIYSNKISDISQIININVDRLKELIVLVNEQLSRINKQITDNNLSMGL